MSPAVCDTLCVGGAVLQDAICALNWSLISSSISPIAKEGFWLCLAKERTCQNTGKRGWEEAHGASSGVSHRACISSKVLDPVTKPLPPGCFQLCLFPAHACRLSIPASGNTICSLCSPALKMVATSCFLVTLTFLVFSSSHISVSGYLLLTYLG